jgi:clan AA aspartic protease
MVTETGNVTSTLEPRIQLHINSDYKLDCIIDTGFTGALLLPSEVADDLKLAIVGREVFQTVGDNYLTASIALVNITWLNQQTTIRAIISDGTDALIGTELLRDTQLLIDYISKVVTVTGGE